MKNEFKSPLYMFLFWSFVILGIAVLVIPVTHMVKWIDHCVSGLALNISGTVILVIFGFPQPDYSGGGLFGFEDGTMDSKTGKTFGTLRAEGDGLARWHTRIAFVGVCYLLCGFVLQLVDHLIGKMS